MATVSSTKGPADCRVCRAQTTHEKIRPVSTGNTYIRCMLCGTVTHTPTVKAEGAEGAHG